jgi:adenosylcobinamide kinase/adenosylcobinamide-phosphate guanylyltransferase
MLCEQAAKAEIDALPIKKIQRLSLSRMKLVCFMPDCSWKKIYRTQGWMNQYIAATADTVVLMVSGIPVTIKDKNKIVMILHHGIYRK